jgi:hypothetical protein
MLIQEIINTNVEIDFIYMVYCFKKVNLDELLVYEEEIKRLLNLKRQIS